MSKKSITAFIPWNGNEYTHNTIENFADEPLIETIYLLTREASGITHSKCHDLLIDYPGSSKTIRTISDATNTSHILLLTRDTRIEPGQFAIERFLNVALMTDSGITYSDYYDVKNDERTPHPVIDYQTGSVRDDFNFGPLLLIDSHKLHASLRRSGSSNFEHAGLYDARLSISQEYRITRIGEYLYSSVVTDTRKSGEKLFDYVDPKNRAVQIELEQAFTRFLKRTGAYLEPKFSTPDFGQDGFPVEASVIIPVRNRVKTIRDAVDSALKQKGTFDFNVIVVDNFSTDGTTDILKEIAAKDNRLIHVIPDRDDLGIGGCWNLGAHHPQCGRFSVQLDSDDVYKTEFTLQAVIDTFQKEKCAMVVGSYEMTNFDLEQIPPGIIDHREWTPDNGRNNAMRINGLGAPRAFFTPLLREIKIPNVSYGEDYALGLAFSRDYQIGRIYEPIYCCRRWDDNTDASLNIPQQNAHNYYKDKIRTFEYLARIRKNARH
ncbi:MAG: glycosyltransferase family 2 protein [Cyclonatronaceae bacterium]